MSTKINKDNMQINFLTLEKNRELYNIEHKVKEGSEWRKALKKR